MKVSEIFMCGGRYGGGYDEGHYDHDHHGYRGQSSYHRGDYGGGHGHGHRYGRYARHYGGLIRLDIL